MSIVEKAVEKLKNRQPEPPVSPAVEAAPAHSAPTIERLSGRTQAGDPPTEAAPPWHVDPVALERAGLLPAGDEANDRLADELRRIKQPLMDNAIGKGAKVLPHAGRIVVTSAVPGEGKSFTAMNLALSLAHEMDFDVLLVDGDIPKSHITRALGLEGHPGLMDVLVDERRQPAEVVVRTDVPNLLVVPVGRRHPLTTELFGSLRMEHVLEELGGRHLRRLVVFDSSPLLATPESQVLASHMGQVVMVVAAGCTGQHAVDSALQSLSDSQYVGLILNMSCLPASENYYNTYYGLYPRVHLAGEA
ncbi:exopolysaccharide biosynthesis protein [Rhodanobacter thiooxydans]|uniref:Exopolysaccharide biosynthesis protein n=1 Tax=Rhodanobacter thiooxydans TaxID=416169 RepID=A0A154QCA1_9GAMM|nr:exopolysaccharide biosynthesis protein [Rhodanobacter thiooxydans]EIM02172.1 protein-tyrosine kinase [Rhodanobacter thiooxydans LCS2]KZC21835.1 exopolysaccharide biosynthesis protein [Rhodanobacter thiooxydans]MCW0200484.1 exopolysaccharide biosynthesis protein [Rhodanobacter thiooxydans]